MTQFNGVLFQFGDYIFPNKFIEVKSFKPKPNQRQNLNAFTDEDGVTHTNPLDHTKTEVTFNTRGMSGEEMDSIMENITRNYLDYNDRNAMCVYYDSENRIYKTGEFYLDQSLQFSIDRLSPDGKKIERYGSMPWTFIEK